MSGHILLVKPYEAEQPEDEETRDENDAAIIEDSSDKKDLGEEKEETEVSSAICVIFPGFSTIKARGLFL